MKRFLLIFTLLVFTMLNAIGQVTVTNVTSTKDNGSYTTDAVIDIVVTFDGLVYVDEGSSDSPRIELNVTPTTRYAVYQSGTGTNELVFQYTVVAGDNVADLDCTSFNYFNGNIYEDDVFAFVTGATLIIGANPGSLSENKNIVIDTANPIVDPAIGVTSNPNAGTLKVFDVVEISVAFTENVYITGKPILYLNVGTNVRYANYISGSGSTTLKFRYTVATGDESTDLEYTGTDALNLNGGTIKDLAGNNATLTLPATGSAGSKSLGDNSSVVIDGVKPTITNVTIPDELSGGIADGIYILDELTDNEITIQVTFKEEVTINTGVGDANIPKIQLETGRNLSYATLDVTGAGSYTATTFNFTYVIEAGHETSDLDYKRTRSFLLEGAIITDAAAGNLADVTLPYPTTAGSISDNRDIAIDAVVPEVSLVSSSSRNGDYKKDDEIIISAAFTEPVFVVLGAEGSDPPRITLSTTPVAYAHYYAGSGNSTLLFKYTVGETDAAARLDYAEASGIELMDAVSIKDAAGNDATRTLPPYSGEVGSEVGTLAQRKNIVIDNTPPAVVTLTSDAGVGPHLLGATIDIVANFGDADERIYVSGRPRLKLNAGSTGNEAYAVYNSGRGTNELLFKYTVGENHTAADLGLALDGANPFPIDLNGGTITDKAGNVVTTSLVGKSIAYGNADPRPIDGIVPSVLNVFADTDGTYMEGNTITLKVLFSANVNVDDDSGTKKPTLALNSDRTTAVATYSSVTDDVVSFTYTVAAGDESPLLDYQRTRSLVLNGGTIKSTSGNDADLTLPSPGTEGSLSGGKATDTYPGNTIVVDGVVPTVNRVSSTASNSSYKEGDVIGITVTFSEEVNVTVDGTSYPTLALNSGGTAIYEEGSGSKVLTFHYTVGALDATDDLDYDEGDISITGSTTITDLAGNEAIYTLPAYTGDPGSEIGTLALRKNIIIDNDAPVIQSISTDAATGTYIIGEKVEIDVVFDEPVYVSGRPRLKLNAGTDAYAYYRRGRGTEILTFEYTVEQGHTTGTSDISFADAANSLELYGGSTITDKAGNDPSSVVGDLTVVDIPVGSITITNSADDPFKVMIDGVAPVVSNVTSSTINGSYKSGSTIAIQVVFDLAVTVNDNSGANKPRLYLNPARTGCYAEYASGSGSTTLVFNYTVAADQNSADLDYLRTRSLDLNGGTIKKATGGANDAVLTLAYPSTEFSLGYNKNIIVDTEAPTVERVASSSSNRTYGVGDKIYITVTFSEEVLASGATSTITLNSGGTASLVAPGVDPTTTLVYEYTVAATEETTDLDYTATNALALSVGTIQDAAGNSATLTLATPGERNSLGRNANIEVDGVAPTITNVSSPNPTATYGAGSDIYIWVEFSEPVLVYGRPEMALNSGVSVVATYLSGTGTNRLTFKYTVSPGESANPLGYGADPISGNIIDRVGNAADLTVIASTFGGIVINAPASKSSKGSNSNNDLISKGFDFSVYPNPSNGIINLNLLDVEDYNYSIVVMDAIGRVVYSANESTTQPQISLDSPPGIYLVRVRVGEKTVTKRFIIK